MLAELSATLAAVLPDATRQVYVRAITEDNCLGKATAATRALSAQNVNEWLADWSALDERISEMYARRSLVKVQNTADKDAERAFNAFLDDIFPKAEAARQKLREKLLASGFAP